MDSDASMSLDEAFEAVKDRASFFNFVDALIEDREDEVEKEKRAPISPYGPGANGGENGTIEAYLSACVRCAEDSGFMPEEPS